MLRCKGDNMINETKLDKDEAWNFIRCMERELIRHQIAQRTGIEIYASATEDTTRRFYEYGEIRHQEDIDMIQKTIDYLKEKWNL